MIQVYPSNSRYLVDLGWLRSGLSFSFGEYFDPENTAFGVMRVCNDDLVAGGKGFGPHPHSDMEIVTVVLRGQVLPVVSHTGSEQVASINQDLTIYLSRLERGNELSFHQEAGRRVFLFIIEGQLEVSGHVLETRDTARIQNEPHLQLAAKEDTTYMLIDLP
ncbi:pirin family protein [Brevibacillus sp. AY1]|uniref:pirin family protein n=1 Tax=Brevibacillus sp. AY1 TaxID=2807621 RepID=UPI002453F31F|nr:pirin family protein [Brevibacillus sp. AY1]MDH4618927.1 pirin family protein [Brevibacillus sp. AY1]